MHMSHMAGVKRFFGTAGRIKELLKNSFFRIKLADRALEQINFENIHSQSLRHAHFGV